VQRRVAVAVWQHKWSLTGRNVDGQLHSMFGRKSAAAAASVSVRSLLSLTLPVGKADAKFFHHFGKSKQI